MKTENTISNCTFNGATFIFPDDAIEVLTITAKALLNITKAFDTSNLHYSAIEITGGKIKDNDESDEKEDTCHGQSRD